MSTFTTPCVVKLIGPMKFELTEEFEYHVGEYPSSNIIKVPVGFKTDFASIPRIFWPILSPVGTYAKAAVVHDYMYRYGLFSRKRCDDIFLEGMKVLNVTPCKRFVIYYAVRIGGWYTWDKTRERDK